MVWRVLGIAATQLTITRPDGKSKDFHDLTVTIMRAPNAPREDIVLRLDLTQMQLLRHALAADIPPLDPTRLKTVTKH